MSGSPTRCAPAPASESRGFSLVELLVSMGIVAILLGLVIAGLGGVRRAGRDAVVLGNLHALGVTLELFTTATNNVYPFVEVGSRIYYEPPDGPHQSFIQSDDRWIARYVWPVTMHEVAPWNEHYLSWLSPEDRPGDGLPWLTEGGSQRYSSYYYSNSFVANPVVWTAGAAPTDADLQPQRSFAVAYPFAKAIMFEPDRRRPEERRQGGRRLVLAVDGAAAARLDAESRPPVSNPLRGGEALLYHDTASGILGRDF